MRRGTALIAVLMVLPSVVLGEGYEKRDALRGIRGFDVLVESLRHEEQLRGSVTREGIKTAAELRLRQLGLPVDGSALRCYLYINVNLLIAEQRLFYSIQLQFKEMLDIPGDKRSPIIATTWSTGSIGTGPVTKAREIQDDVLQLVDEFANDYLAANAPRLRQSK